MTRRLLRALPVALLASCLPVAAASAAVSQADAGRRALASFGVAKSNAPVVVFKVARPVGSGQQLAQAGSAAPPAITGRLGIATSPTPSVLQVAKGHRAWVFYADWAPYKTYAHRGQLLTVDVDTGAVRRSRILSSPPVIGGALPAFMRSGAAYRAPEHRIFERTYRASDVDAFHLASEGSAHRLDRTSLASDAGAKAAADQLAADHACILRVSDTYGDFYDFTGADATRAALGDLFFALRQLNPGIVDQRYSRTSKLTPAAALRALIERNGCKDVLVYLAGRGYSSGPGTTVASARASTRTSSPSSSCRLPTWRASSTRPRGRVLRGGSMPRTRGRSSTRSRGSPTFLFAGSAAGADGSSFGALPYVTSSAGTRITNGENPDGLLTFTNRKLQGIRAYLASADRVNAVIAARRAGTEPSLLAVLLGRPLSANLAEPVVTPAATPAPTATPAPNRTPVATADAVVTAEDTPLTFTAKAGDPDGDPLTLTISTAPTHGTATVSVCRSRTPRRRTTPAPTRSA